jgi:hypothetical protein
MTVVGKKLKALGFKKIPGTEPGFHMYELNPAELGSRQRIHDNLKAEAANDARSVKTANKLASKRAHKLDK